MKLYAAVALPLALTVPLAGPAWADSTTMTTVASLPTGALSYQGQLTIGNGALYAAWQKVEEANNYVIQVLDSNEDVLNSYITAKTEQAITGLDNGVEYKVTVTALTPSGSGLMVGVWTGTPLPVANRPTAAPSITATSYSSISAKVAALAAPGGEPITGYQVRAVSEETGAEYTAATDGPNDFTATITGLDPNQTYDVSYAGLNTVDGETVLGPYGPAVQSVPTGAPAPANLRVERSGNHLVYLDWDDTPGAVRYYVYTNPASDPSAEKTVTTIRSDAPPSEKVVTGLDNGVDYEFEVAAVTVVDGKDKIGERSDVLVASPTSPAIPSDFVVETEANQSVYFEWNPVSDAQGYYIKTAVNNANGIANPAVPAPVLMPNPTPEVREVVKGLTNGVEYAFSIATRTDNVAGDYSEPILATPRAVPGSPNVVKKTVSKSAITVTLTAPAAQTGVPAADRYRVFFTPNIGEQIVVDTNTTTATATGLVEGMTYSITAWAGNANGYGPYDFTPLVLVAADKPGSVISPSAVREDGGSVIVLNWTQPSYSGGAAKPSGYRITVNPLDPQDYDPPNQNVTDTSAVFVVDAEADYTFGIQAVTDGGNSPYVFIGSLAATPTAGAASYDYTSGEASFTFTAVDDPYLDYQARAVQDTAGSDTIVTAADVSCSANACVATFDSFADNINGEKWAFEVRATDNTYSTSNWSKASVPDVADASSSTKVNADTQAVCAVGTFNGSQCVESKAYTYHWVEGPCTDWTGPDEFGWWYCTRHDPGHNEKDATPAGWVDEGGQWVRYSAADIYDNYAITSTFPWTVEGREAAGTVNMTVNGQFFTGNPVGLGRCPGNVAVKLAGLGGGSSSNLSLCN